MAWYSRGLNAIIVNPGVIIGAGFWNHGGSASLFKKAFSSISHYSTGNTGFIDVTDLTKNYGISHEKIHNQMKITFVLVRLTFKAFFDLLCVEFGKVFQKEKPLLFY